MGDRPLLYLIAFLLEHGWPVYPVNPNTIDRHRSASGAKTDRIDAYLLAKVGRADFADLRLLQPDSPIIAELKALTRDQDGLVRSQTRLVNQLTACPKAYYPVALQLFSKVQQHVTLAFLQMYPTPQVAMTASVEQLTQTLKQAKHPQARIAALKIFEQIHQPHLMADAITTRTRSRLMLALVKQLLPLVEEIANYDKEIERLFLTHATSARFQSLLVPASVWLPGCWRKSVMIGAGMLTLPVCKPWLEPRWCSFRAVPTLKRIGGMPVSSRCVMPCSNLPGNRL